MDESRYGKTPRRRILALGIPPAVAMMTLGGYWTLLAWGVVGNQPETACCSLGCGAAPVPRPGCRRR